MRIVRAAFFGFGTSFIPGNMLDHNKKEHIFSSYVHRLWVANFDNRKALRLFGREETELNFLDVAHRRMRVGEMHVRHDCGLSVYRRDDEVRTKVMADGVRASAKRARFERDAGRDDLRPVGGLPKS
jgi:hypothetical protein